MANTSTAGKGTLLKITSVSPDLTVGEVTALGGPSRSHRMSEVTHTESTAAEFVSIIRDEGEFQATCNFVPDNAGQLEVREAFAAGNKMTFSITFTDAAPTIYTFDAFVTQYNTPMDMGSHLVCTFSLRIDGPITES